MKNKLKSIFKSCFLSLIVSYVLIKGIFFFSDFYFSVDSMLEKSIIFGSSNIEMGKKWYENIIFSLFARHGRALTGASPEHAQVVGNV